MKNAKGFSLIEILFALTLSSLIIMILTQNLMHLVKENFKMYQEWKVRSASLTALVFLDHAIQSSMIQECSLQAPKTPFSNLEDQIGPLVPVAILTSSSDPLIKRWGLEKSGSGQLKTPSVLMIHHLIKKGYLKSANEPFPSSSSSEWLLLDDCSQSMIVQGGLHSLPPALHYPVSVSLIETSVYYLAKGKANEKGLYESINQGAREEQFKPLSDFQFTMNQPHVLHLRISPYEKTIPLFSN